MIELLNPYLYDNITNREKSNKLFKYFLFINSNSEERMTNQLKSLKKMTTVVADTGDFEAIKVFNPQDATTNPSLILKAIQIEKYQPLLKQATAWAKDVHPDNVVEAAADKLAVLIGGKLLEQVPGLVSTEVDAHLSFDTTKTVAKARQLLALYKEQGVDPNRILIKIAATWEGIQAARILQQEGVNCNVTLLFSFAQAKACAEADVFLISPFVGRILDWYKKNQPDNDFQGANDPGVKSVTQIYNYFKQHDYKTIVMGASFRSSEEIRQLAGCDRLTISPALLEELANTQGELQQVLQPEQAAAEADVAIDEQQFRWLMNQDAMASEKLAEGIRQFAVDQKTLEATIKANL